MINEILKNEVKTAIGMRQQLVNRLQKSGTLRMKDGVPILNRSARRGIHYLVTPEWAPSVELAAIWESRMGFLHEIHTELEKTPKKDPIFPPSVPLSANNGEHFYGMLSD